MFGFIKNWLAGFGRRGGGRAAEGPESQAAHDFIGRYQVLGELGRGGMGVVVLAQDPFIERKVAIKTTRAPSPEHPAEFMEFTRRFFHEAKAVGQLNHPNIVGVYDAMVEDGRGCLVMEYVDGVSLSRYITPDKLPGINTIVKVSHHCAKALEYAHQHGVIHRDVKPANIMISRKSEVKLSDFGIASIEGRSDRKEGEVTASVNYASPEQLRNDALTPHSDIFSLGVVIYEMLTGKKPFEADNPMAVIYKILNEEPAPIKTYRPDCPDSLVRIVEQLLSKNPDDRHRSDSHLLAELSSSFRHLRFMEEEINFEEKFNVIRDLKFFKEFSTSELVEILKAAQWIKFEPGTAIVREGEAVKAFFVVVTGRVLVRKRGMTLFTLGPGEVFGQTGGLKPTAQTAAVQSGAKSVVMKFDTGFLETISPATQVRFYKRFNHHLNRQLTATGKLLMKGL